MLAAACAVSAASRPASRILRRAAGLALIAAAAAARAADEDALFVPSPYATPAKPEEAELAELMLPIDPDPSKAPDARDET